MLEIKTNEAESAAKIIVIGVGGAGNNAVNRMIYENIAKSIEDCEDPIIVIEDYKILGLFTKYVFTKNPLETIELLNQTILDIDQ